MRQTRDLGLRFHLQLALDFWSTGAGHTSRVLWIVLFWFIGGILLVEGRPTPSVIRYGIHERNDHEYTSAVGVWERDGAEGPEHIVGTPKPAPEPEPGRTPKSLADPVNIALATIGGIAGLLFIGTILYKCYSRWSRLNNEPIWPPLDAPRDEVGQLVELIRMGMIDAHGAPPHVVNWVLNGIDAPWPPPGGIQSLYRRRRRQRPSRRREPRLAGTAERSGRTRTGSFVLSADGVIELPRRTRTRTIRPLSTSTTVDPLPIYVQDPEMDSSHYPITILPQEFPPLPPDFSTTFQPSTSPTVQHAPSGGDVNFSNERITSSAGSSSTGDYIDDDSEVGSRRTASLRDNDETPLTGLTPRPPPPAVLASSGRNSLSFHCSGTNATGISNV